MNVLAIRKRCDLLFKVILSADDNQWSYDREIFKVICGLVRTARRKDSTIIMVPALYMFILIKHRPQRGKLIKALDDLIYEQISHNHLFDEFLCQETNASQAYGDEAFVNLLPEQEKAAYENKNYNHLSVLYQSIKSDMEDKYIENYEKD